MDNIPLQAASEERVRAGREARREAREAARPSRNDNLIAGVIQAPINAMPMALLLLFRHFPINRPPTQLLPKPTSARRSSCCIRHRTGSQRMSALNAVSSGQEPPSKMPHKSDDLVMGFQEIQSQDLQYRYSSFYFGHLSVLSTHYQSISQKYECKHPPREYTSSNFRNRTRGKC